ncbi:MAG: DUF1080 domain-containing protein [Verrucomicrobia bacterium]|nr:DUF1080 domain-containing protein [Verrucomicrobiota bacterium]MDA1065795.1 DUF1080 domain-containing protein [Verrucomicrobiota bacterium]
MKLPLLISFLLFLGHSAFSAVEPIPPFMGDWQGGWVNAPAKDGNAKNNPALVARVIGLGGDLYEIQIMEEFDKRADYKVKTESTWKNGKLSFDQKEYKGEITASTFTGTKTSGDLVTPFELKRLHRTSPTAGLEPPLGAIVLFDGKNMDAWQHGDGEKVTWTVKNGVVEILPKKENNDKGGSITTRQSFGDVKVHLEFNLPYEPEGREQHRGNSGFFVPGGYEIQILDSYGLGGMWNECGALYKQSPPQVNMCWAPGVWQTYDIEFKRMRMDAEGNKVDDAVISVWHNGKLVHNQLALKGTTSNNQAGRMLPESGKSGSLSLQDHSHKLQFRNIWVVEL